MSIDHKLTYWCRVGLVEHMDTMLCTVYSTLEGAVNHILHAGIQDIYHCRCQDWDIRLRIDLDMLSIHIISVPRTLKEVRKPSYLLPRYFVKKHHSPRAFSMSHNHVGKKKYHLNSEMMIYVLRKDSWNENFFIWPLHSHTVLIYPLKSQKMWYHICCSDYRSSDQDFHNFPERWDV